MEASPSSPAQNEPEKTKKFGSSKLRKVPMIAATADTKLQPTTDNVTNALGLCNKSLRCTKWAV